MKSAATPRRLMLLRHGKAVRSRPGDSDFDRTLEPRGVADAEKIGAYLTRHRLIPDRVLVSPAARAKETWERAAVHCPKAPPAEFDPRLYDAKPDRILTILKDLGDVAGVLVVGHNPALHDLATLLIASGDVENRERLQENLPTAGLVVIDFAVDRWSKVHPQSGRLELLVRPKTLDSAVD